MKNLRTKRYPLYRESSFTVYIVSITDETFNNKTAQKGSAISRINAEDGYQLYKFTAYASENSLIEGDNTSSEVTQPLPKNEV